MNFDDFDFGGLDLGDIDLGNLDFGGVDLGGADLGGMDLGNIDLGGMDLSGLEGMDLSGIENLDLSGLSGMDFDSLGLEGLAAVDNLNLTNTDFGSKADLGSFEDIKDVDYLNDMFGTGNQDFGTSTDVDKSLSDMGDRGTKLTSDWQKTKDGRYVKINDDGSGIGIDEDGNSFALSTSQVGDRIKSGDLNTYASGYNTATGGNKTAPGGGSSVVLKNGQAGQLLTTGKVIDTNTGKTIGTEKDVKTVVTQDGDGKTITTGPGGTGGGTGGGGTKGGGSGGGGSGSGTKTGAQQNSLSSILPLLLAMLAMNKDKGGGEGKATVIPGLTATQKQTPYSQQQRAPGYRPGQGGITYFDQAQYAPKMASGGITRLLKGPGDGVSDSIPAVITNGMSKGGQPARVARGEYIIDARTVAALGNGSTDAGAERLDKMRKNILRDDRKAGVGKDSKAYRHLMA